MTKDKRKTFEGWVFLALFCLTIPAANWMIGNVGTVCPRNEPCVIPVAPGLLAPSGVLMVGAALVLRDLVQRRLGVAYGVGAILIGAGLSAALAPAALVVASAVAASSIAGLVVDSIVFLYLAFGSLDFLAGQIVGKLWMVLIALPLIAYLRRRDERLGLTPA